MNKRAKAFQDIVWRHFREEGRHFSWRKNNNLSAYKIWVSEIMLQQTQTSRVEEKIKPFLRKFPSAKKLSEAGQGAVLAEWVGLGYNRRALNLWKGAKYVRDELNGRIPKTVEELEKIQGIGHYTARAVATFAFDQRHAFVETNIRTVYFNHFFKGQENVTDKEILEMVEKTLPEENFREWYWALMDYGVWLKGQGKGMNSKSRHYTKQSKFEGSDRQIRAAIVRYLAKQGKTSVDNLVKNLDFDGDRIEEQIQKQYEEGMIHIRSGIVSLG
jgi:A/G-specific adenine glycosylase